MEKPGKILNEARKKKDISLREASLVTKIGVPFLKALENDEYDVFPNWVYLRSFLKNYANFLGLDGEELAERLKSDDFPQATEPLPLIKSGESTMRLWLMAGAMILIWILWTIYQTVVVKF